MTVQTAQIVMKASTPSAAMRLGAALLGAACLADAGAAVLTVGPGKQYAQPCAAIVVARSGDTVEITGTPGSSYKGDTCRVASSYLTIRGVGSRPHIEANGRNTDGKGVWVVTGNNVTVENVEISGAKVPDHNGAALRIEGNNFTLTGSYLHDNENGILSGASPTSRIVLEKNEFARNGDGTGQTHNVYIGDVASLTFRYNYSHDANVGHNLKSRARINTVLYNRFSSTPGIKGGKPSYEIDLPGGGIAYVIGNVIHQPAENENSTILAFGAEDGSKPDNALYVINNTFLNDGRGGTFVMIGKQIKTQALLQNNLFAGAGTVTNQASVIQKSNYQSQDIGFVDRANFDLHPTANARVINAGSAPPVLANNVVLQPSSQYKHVASGEPRPVIGTLDLGAYQTVIVEPGKSDSWFKRLIK